jgi:hypothetical protein
MYRHKFPFSKRRKWLFHLLGVVFSFGHSCGSKSMLLFLSWIPAPGFRWDKLRGNDLFTLAQFSWRVSGQRHGQSVRLCLEELELQGDKD